MQCAFTDAISSAREELVVEVARTPAQILEAKRLRFRVYCEERGFEPGKDGLEQDAFDHCSQHVLVRSRQSGSIYGTVRVALAAQGAPHVGFPMETLCESYVFAALPRSATGEVSRFALVRDRVGISPAAAGLMRLCLIQGVIQVCGEVGLTHLCALMEKTLLRLLRSTSIHFAGVGPTIEHRGTRQPAVWKLGDGLQRVHHENPVVWSFITRDGTLWSQQAVLATAARNRLVA